MGRMAGLCGGTIRDHLIPCPTEGWVLRDQDQDAFLDAASQEIPGFVAAVREGRRREWIGQRFTPQYPADITDREVISDLLAGHKRQAFLSVAECEECGRLWVQRGPGINAYRSYAPDEPGYAGGLRAGPAAEPDDPV